MRTMLFSANQPVPLADGGALAHLRSLQDRNRYINGVACIKAIVLDQVTI